MRYILYALFLFDAPLLAQDLAMEITLTDALSTSQGTEQRVRPAHVLVRKVNGHWQPALVLGDRFNANYGRGFVRTFNRPSPTEILFSVAGHIRDDPWVKAGWGTWLIKLQQQSERSWHGTFTGTFAGQEVSGKAHARIEVLPPQNTSVTAKRARPRLLFQTNDIPRLQARLNTAFGIAARDKMVNAPGLAVRYALTKDPELAKAAMEQTRILIEDQGNGSKHVAHRVWSWRLIAVAIAYDCASDAWPEAFQQQTRQWMQRVIDRIYFQHQAWTEYTGFSIGHRFSGFYLGAAAIGSLALVGEPGLPPQRPTPYLNGHDIDLPLPKNTIAFPAGAPQNMLIDGSVPTAWNYVGGLFLEESQSVLDQLGSAKKGLFQTGHTLSANDFEAQVAQLPAEAFRHGGIDITKANNHAYFSENWFATVIEVQPKQAGWYRFSAGHDAGIQQGEAWLSETPIKDGAVFKLQEGRYPLVIRASIAQTNAWGMIQIKPRFIALDPTAAQEKLAFIRLTEKLQNEQYDFLRAYHHRTNGASARAWEDFAFGEALVSATLRHIVGDGGFQAHLRDPNFILENIIRYPALYKNVMGRNLGATQQIEAYLPRLLFSQVYNNQGGRHSLDINGPSSMKVKDWFDPMRDCAPELFACLFPVIHEKIQPAVHFLWHQHLGITNEETIPKVLSSHMGKSRHQLNWQALDTHPVFAFVNYPYEKKPASTATAMPKTWQADGFGWLGSRNAFVNEDDAVLQIYAKTRPAPHPMRENAGAVRLHGLKQNWWIGPNEFAPQRFFESIPRPALSPIPNPGAFGTILQSSFTADGSGSASIDLSDTYRTVVDQNAYAPKLGGQPDRNSLAPSTVKAQRTVGIDFSGKSGAPVLFVIADELQGVEDPRWVYHVESVHQRYGRWEIIDKSGNKVKKSAKRKLWRQGIPEGYTLQTERYPDVQEHWQPTGNAQISIHGNQFTIQRGDATLAGTVIADTPVTLKTTTNSKHYQLLQAKNNHHDYRMATWGIDVAGADRWLVVMTIQRGEPPAVHARNIDSPVTVGQQTIEWKNNLITFK